MNTENIDKRYVLAGGGLILLLIIFFVWGKTKGKTEKETKEIDVKVNIEDGNGQVIVYDPNPLLERLNTGLTSTIYWSYNTMRCQPMKELYALSTPKFIAAIKGYKAKYSVDIQTHMNACYMKCNNITGASDFDLVYQRIENSKDLF